MFSVVFVIFVCVVLRFTNHSRHTAVTTWESEERMVEENCVIYLFVCSGPASVLFEKSYYELMKAALRSGGIICSQGIWIQWCAAFQKCRWSTFNCSQTYMYMYLWVCLLAGKSIQKFEWVVSSYMKRRQLLLYITVSIDKDWV